MRRRPTSANSVPADTQARAAVRCGLTAIVAGMVLTCTATAAAGAVTTAAPRLAGHTPGHAAPAATSVGQAGHSPLVDKWPRAAPAR